MAYDYLSDAMDESNRVQQDYQRRNPVVPNAAPAAPVAESVYGDPGSGAMIPVNEPPQSGGRLPDFLRDPLGAVNNAVRPDSPSAQSYRANAGIDPSVLTPRLDPPMQPGGTQPIAMTSEPLAQFAPAAQPAAGGPITTAAAKAVPDFISGVYNNPQEVEYARQNARYRAQDKADFEARMDRQVAQGAAAQAGVDLDRQRGDQRVADAQAKWRAYDVAGGIGGEGRYAAADLAAANAARVGAATAAAEGRVANANEAYTKAGTRDYIGDNLKQQALDDQSDRTKIAAANVKVDAEGRALDNEGKRLGNIEKGQKIASEKEIAAVQAQLAAETDPKKQAELQRKLLTMQGKQPGKNIAIIDTDGPPDVLGNPTVRKVAVNTDTGEILQPKKEAAAATPPPNHIAALKANPKLAEQFDAKYGKGEAKKILDALTGK